MSHEVTCEKCLQLEQALESRTTIAIAIGLLMEREGIDKDAAFDMLRIASQRTNRKLRDIAAVLVSDETKSGGPSDLLGNAIGPR